ncbi:hypothetical protein E4U32_001389 [Claviceps aff. humidiphila group G2b]|nr:hypothetical protein E4U32_001389 [Claviceps aff. humidiphila group G2b]
MTSTPGVCIAKFQSTAESRLYTTVCTMTSSPRLRHGLTARLLASHTKRSWTPSDRRHALSNQQSQRSATSAEERLNDEKLDELA